MVLAGGVVMGLGFLAWYLSPVAWAAAPIALLVGFGTYLYHNTLQTNATQMMTAVRGTAVALFAFCLFFGQALGVTFAGAAFDRFGPAPLLVVAAVALPLAGWALARALQRRAAA
jgi:predicted MFS family arabinose efflux permease